MLPLLLAAALLSASPYRQSPYVGALAMETATGRILLSDHAERKCYPASCTKLMTLYVALEELSAGRIALADRVFITPEALKEQPSVSGLKRGDSLTMDQLLKALMVKSANDAAVMIAQHIAGREVGDFIAMMNQTAKQLGMTNTVYCSPNGLPPPKGSKRGFDSSTASDLARLACALLKNHPEALKYTSLATCTLVSGNGSRLEYTNHNNLLAKPSMKMSEVDGLKTGYIDAGGSSIVLTGNRNGKRAMVVVVGSASGEERDLVAGRLLSDALGAISW